MLSPLHSPDQKQPNPTTSRQTDRDYEPKEEEVISYAYSLGFQFPQDNDLLHISREGLTAPVPSPWKVYYTETDELFYYHPGLLLSVWEHPLDEFYRQLYKQAKTDKRKRELLKKENKIERERARDFFWKRKREIEELYEKRIVESRMEKEGKLQAIVSSKIEDIEQKRRSFSPIGKGMKEKSDVESDKKSEGDSKGRIQSDEKSKNEIVIETLKKENEQRLRQLEKDLEEKREKAIRNAIKELRDQSKAQIVESVEYGDSIYEGVTKEEEQEYREHLEAINKEQLALAMQELDDQRRMDRESIMKGLGEEDRSRIQKLARSLGEKYKAEVEKFEEYKMQKEQDFEQEMVLKNREYEREFAVEKENMMNGIRKNFQKLKEEQEEKELRLEELNNELDYYFDISPNIRDTNYKTIKQKSHSKLKGVSDILGQKEQFLKKLDQHKSRLQVEVSILKGLVEETEETNRTDDDCKSSNKLLEYLSEELSAREYELMQLRSEMREIKPTGYGYRYKHMRSSSVSASPTQWDLIKDELREKKVNRDPDYVTEIFDNEMSLIKAGYSSVITGNSQDKSNLMKKILEIEKGIKDQMNELEKSQQKIERDIDSLDNKAVGRAELNLEMTIRIREVLEEKLSTINRNLENLKKLSKWTQSYLKSNSRRQSYE